MFYFTCDRSFSRWSDHLLKDNVNQPFILPLDGLQYYDDLFISVAFHVHTSYAGNKV